MVIEGSNPTIQTWPEVKFYRMRSPAYEGCVIGYDESDARCGRLRLCEQSYRIDNDEQDNTPGDDADEESSDEELFPDAVTPVTPPAPLLNDEQIQDMWGFLDGFL